MRTFASRTAKDILRDPLTLAFGLGFPLVLLLLLTAIQAHVPADLFGLEQLTPGVCVFGMAFLTLFSAQLIARDRSSALLQRLFTTPLMAVDYIGGYLLPLLPMAVAQEVVCYGVALLLGLTPTWRIVPAMAAGLVAAVFFIALGLLCGSVLNDRQVGGLCGALLTNLTAFLSGAWFDPALVGGWFEKLAGLLPFLHATRLGQALLAGNTAAAMPHLGWVAAYAAVALGLAVPAFLRKMQE
jgi:ABC-2 type transport system permease protein